MTQSKDVRKHLCDIWIDYHTRTILISASLWAFLIVRACRTIHANVLLETPVCSICGTTYALNSVEVISGGWAWWIWIFIINLFPLSTTFSSIYQVWSLVEVSLEVLWYYTFSITKEGSSRAGLTFSCGSICTSSIDSIWRTRLTFIACVISFENGVSWTRNANAILYISNTDITCLCSCVIEFTCRAWLAFVSISVKYLTSWTRLTFVCSWIIELSGWAIFTLFSVIVEDTIACHTVGSIIIWSWSGTSDSTVYI